MEDTDLLKSTPDTSPDRFLFEDLGGKWLGRSLALNTGSREPLLGDRDLDLEGLWPLEGDPLFWNLELMGGS